jgi:hypothetical protein
VVFPARQMIFDVIGDLLADRHQRKQFGFNERIAVSVSRPRWSSPILWFDSGRLFVFAGDDLMDQRVPWDRGGSLLAAIRQWRQSLALI